MTLQKRVLSSFLQFLPIDGRRALAEAITVFNNDTLRALSSHLVRAILIPSEFSLCFTHSLLSTDLATCYSEGESPKSYTHTFSL